MNKKLFCTLSLLLSSVLLFGCAGEGGTPRKDVLTTYDPISEASLSPAQDDLGGATETTVAFYKFNEGSGGIVTDETGRHHGTLVNGGSSARVKGKYGNAIQFASNRNQYVYVEDAPELSPAAITVEMVVKFDPASRYIPYQRLIFKDWSYNVFLENLGTPWLNFNLYTETNTAWETAKVRLNGEVFDGKWHHIAFCYDGVSGLTRGYFDYRCEDSVYLTPGVIMQANEHNPLYIGAGYWANSVQQPASVTIDALRISSQDLYAYDFLDSTTETDNYLQEMAAEETTGELVYDVPLLPENGNKVKDSEGNELGGMTAGEATYTEEGLYLKQGEREASFSADPAKFTSGDLSVQVVVRFDEHDVPDPYDQLDGTVIYKGEDFMICTYVYDAGGGTLGYLVTWRIRIADAPLISVENQMSVNYNVYDGKPHCLALNYNSETATMDGYIDYRKVKSKNFAELGVSDPEYRMNDNPVLLGRSINNWHGNGWYSRVRLSDGNTAARDMFGYSEQEETPGTESGELVCDVGFNEKAGSPFSVDGSGNANHVYFVGGAGLYADGEAKVLRVGAENEDAGYLKNAASLNPSSVTVQIVVKLGDMRYGLHRLVFKDFQYDVCLDYKSGGAGLSVKLNTQRDGWLTRAAGNADVLLDGNYHRVAMSYSGLTGECLLAIDGNVIDSRKWEGGLLAGTQDLYLGAGFWSGALRQGGSWYLDDLKIYNYALAAEEL